MESWKLMTRLAVKILWLIIMCEVCVIEYFFIIGRLTDNKAGPVFYLFIYLRYVQANHAKAYHDTAATQ